MSQTLIESKKSVLTIAILDHSPVYAKGVEVALSHYFYNCLPETSVQFTHFYPLSLSHLSIISDAAYIFHRVRDKESLVTLKKKLFYLRKNAPSSRIILYTYEFNPACAKVLSNSKRLFGYFILADKPENLNDLLNTVINENKVALSTEVKKAVLVENKHSLLLTAPNNNTTFTIQEAKAMEVLYKNKSVEFYLNYLQLDEAE